MQSDLSNVYIKHALKFQTDLSLQIKAGTTNQLVVQANHTDGALAFCSGDGGITLDASVGTGTLGSATTFGPQIGAITLKSQADSSWAVQGANLALSATGTTESTTTGDITKSSGAGMTLTAGAGIFTIESPGNDLDLTTGANLNATATTDMILGTTYGLFSVSAHTTMDLDSLGDASFGATNATGVTIGNGNAPTTINGNTTTISGNLVVNGSTTTINSTTMIETDNLLVLNSNSSGIPAGSGNDGGFLVDRSAADMLAHDTPVVAAGVTTGVTTGTASGTTVNLAAGTDNYNGSYIKIASGLFANQARQISGMDGTTPAATVTAWTPVALVGTNFAVSGSGTALTITGFGSEQLSVGSNIEISGNNYIVTSVTGAGVYVLNGGTDVPTAGAANLIAPGAGVTYNIYDQTFVGMFWQESSQKFVYAATKSDLGQGPVAVDRYLNVKMNNLEANTISSSSFSVSGTDAAVWSGSALTAALLLTGGLGVEKNVVVRTDATSVAQFPMSLAQTNASTGLNAVSGVGAVLALTQADPTQAVLSVTGASAGDSVNTDGTLINTAAGENASLTTILQGFMRVNVHDTGSSNPLNGGAPISYYSPLYSISV